MLALLCLRLARVHCAEPPSPETPPLASTHFGNVWATILSIAKRLGLDTLVTTSGSAVGSTSLLNREGVSSSVAGISELAEQAQHIVAEDKSTSFTTPSSEQEGHRHVSALLAVLERDPDDLAANSAMGAALMHKPELAEEFLINAAVLSNWTDLSAILNLAECQRTMNRLESAESIAYRGLEAAQKDNDFTAGFSFLIGSIEADRLNYRNSSEWYLAASVLQPWNTLAWLRASTIQFPAEYVNLKFAENVLIEAYKHLANESYVHYYLGLVMQRTERPSEAIIFFEAAYSLDDMDDVLSSLAIAYHTASRFDEAYEMYARYVRRVPSDALMLTNFAALLFEREQYADCAISVEAALRINPSSNDAGRLLQQIGEIAGNKSEL